jgi:hypothetical protein
MPSRSSWVRLKRLVETSSDEAPYEAIASRKSAAFSQPAR